MSLGCRCSSMVKCLPSEQKALGSLLSVRVQGMCAHVKPFTRKRVLSAFHMVYDQCFSLLLPAVLQPFHLGCWWSLVLPYPPKVGGTNKLENTKSSGPVLWCVPRWQWNWRWPSHCASLVLSDCIHTSFFLVGATFFSASILHRIPLFHTG
jgi:hypothetical protein